MVRTRQRVHTAFLMGVGLAGWGLTVALTAIDPPWFRSWTWTWELGACLALGSIARMLAFRAFRRVRIALDSAFHVAVGFVFGMVPAAWVILLTLGGDTLIRLIRGSSAGASPRMPLVTAIAHGLYKSGLPALLLLILGSLFDDRTLYPQTDLALDWKLPLFAVLFLVSHYLLATATEWYQGSGSRVLLQSFVARAVTAELTLVPLAIAMVLGHKHQGIGLFLLLEATGLLFNAVFRQGAITADKLRDRISELSTLNKVGRIIAGSLERNLLLENLARETLRLVGRDSVFMIGVVERGGSAVSYEIFNEEGERYMHLLAPVGEGLSGWVMRNRRALNLGDMQREWQLYLDDYSYNDPRFNSWLGVPLVIYDDVLGVLVVQTESRYAYTLNTMRVLTTIADQAAVALENSRLYELATVDGLTGLYVRRYFDHRVSEEWGRSERYGVPFTVGILDLDNFKRLNDTFGHQVGDRVLKDAAAALRNNMRSFDVAARYGGEEFAIILPRTDVSKGVKVAERVRRDIEKLMVMDGKIPVTVSIGVAGFPAEGLDKVEELVARADQALYQAKEEGKNRVVVTPFGQTPPSKEPRRSSHG